MSIKLKRNLIYYISLTLTINWIKKIDNLPIGLFGDFYSHELSFNLINKNDLKNLKNIFNECNLKIKNISKELYSREQI